MPARIRLQRYGKKHKPFYHIVIADGRAPRDGKFIETIGTYDPLTNPVDIVLNFDKALDWLQKGAQPTDTVRILLSYKGVLYKNHLLKGVKKGALTEEQAEAKYNAWLSEKNAKIDQKRSEHQLGIRELEKSLLAGETKINEAKASKIAKKKADELEKKIEKAKEAVKTDTAEDQEDEVRTPKELELKEAIEEKAKEEVAVAGAVAEKKEEVAVAGADKKEKEEVAVAGAVAEKKEEVAVAGAVAEKKEEEAEKKEEAPKEEKK